MEPPASFLNALHVQKLFERSGAGAATANAVRRDSQSCQSCPRGRQFERQFVINGPAVVDSNGRSVEPAGLKDCISRAFAAGGQASRP